VLLADEPTSELDHDNRERVLALLRAEARRGAIVIMATHDPEVAARLPRTVTIRDGRVGGEGRSGEAYAVVSADGSLPLPPAAVGAFPPGALVRVHEVDGVWTLIPQGRGETGE
jgi:ABC-type multidrug transport system ATPase subunit